jgi:hypothetical protein
MESSNKNEMNSNSIQLNTIGKIIRFFSAIFLADITILYCIYKYFIKLNKRGIIELSPDFNGTAIIWGNSIYLNIIHLILIAIAAGLFGFTFGYLSRKLNKLEKLIFTLLYVFFKIILIELFTIISNYFNSKQLLNNDFILSLIGYFTDNSFNFIFGLLYYSIMYISAYYFLKIGEITINNPLHYSDKDSKSTFFDIKWYHYIWLSWPISFYLHFVLDLIYKIGITINTLFENLRFDDIFDWPTENNLDIAGHNLFLIIGKAIIATTLMGYQRKIIIGKNDQHWYIKLLLTICISFILPFLIIYYNTYCVK